MGDALKRQSVSIHLVCNNSRCKYCLIKLTLAEKPLTVAAVSKLSQLAVQLAAWIGCSGQEHRQGLAG